MKNLKKYLIAEFVALVMAFIVFISCKGFKQDTTKELLRVLNDSTFITAVLFTGFGLLIFASNEGTFDMLVYGMQSFLGLFRSKANRRYDSFADYRAQKAQEKISNGFILVTGLTFLILSIILFIIYKNLK